MYRAARLDRRDGNQAKAGGKSSRTDTTTKRLQQWSISMDVGAWPGDGGQGVLTLPGRVRGNLRGGRFGELLTEQVAEL
jgi:hypothetical protein